MISVTSETTVKTIKSAENLMADLQAIAQYQVLVGVPEEKDTRLKGEVGNAMLAYVHDNGSPKQGIPARP